MPFIQISIAEGRTDDQVRDLVKELTEATVRTIGSKREAVRIIVTQVSGTHWANGGVTVADEKAAQEAAASNES
ncbi:2-hydroxymuconate tautomerase family protein [Microbacterium pumilum]